MTAAILWIVLPAVLGALIGLGRFRYPWSPAIGVLAAAGLSMVGLFLPVDETVAIGPVDLLIRSEQIVLGRSFIIGIALARIIGGAYGALALWGIGSQLLGANRFFVPSGLISTALLCAALAVQPWQFAGIFILLAVFVLVPLLAPPGAGPAAAGVLKFVAFQAIGVPFLIVAGTLMEGLESIPSGLSLTLRPGIFLGLSFIFLLAVFPFHGWIPGLGEDHAALPYGFVLVLLPGFIGVLGLELIDRYAFLRNSPELFTLIRTVGLLSVVAGSALVVVQRHAGRILGYTALVETGLLLVAAGAGPDIGPGLFFPVIAARSAGFLIWSAGLAWMANRGIALDFSGMQGVLREHPLGCAAVLAGIFSTAGFPLLAGFPVKLRLAASLAEIDPTAVFAVWLAMTAIAAAGVRTFAVMIAPQPERVAAVDAAAQAGEFPDQAPSRLTAAAFPVVLLAGGSLLLILFGLFPGWIAWLVERMPPAFEHLSR